MARRISKKKQKRREEFMLKEKSKVEEGVFDTKTMLTLRRLFSHGVISGIEFIIAVGKEADVYLAAAGEKVREEFVIVKIFRVETTGFIRRKEYIIGDPRFGKVKGNLYNYVNVWCKKEYGNLKIAAALGVRAPVPYAFSGNVLGMQMIGEEGHPSPSLRNTRLGNPDGVLDYVIEDIRKLYGGGLVHGDISEYNILMKGNVPYLIDFGQAVVIRHPHAMEFLHRDITNLLAYFERAYGIKRDYDRTLAYVLSAGKERNGNV